MCRGSAIQTHVALPNDPVPPSDLLGEEGAALLGPAGNDVEAPRQQAGTEAVPAWEAGGEPAEGLAVSLFERQEEPVNDVASCLPAPAGRVADRSEPVVLRGPDVALPAVR